MAVARTEKIGWVGVDYARLLIADVDALGSWKHDECLDGLADFVFWGADTDQVARALDAPRLESDGFGWCDVPEAVAQERGLLVEEHRDNRALKVATDYRPHSHHWRVMGPTRKSSSESGMTEIDGLTVCNFMTTWGDGVFDVYRDMDAAGRLVRIRIEFKSIE